ncbi:MAG: hypothetical protein WD607_02800 [Candidatus Paceibacterota bacterium]
MEKSLEKPVIKNPHVVIIGAGASIQAFPEGDKNGYSLPSMSNLAKIPVINSTLDKHGIKDKINDFEAFFSELFKSSKIDLLNDLETAIHSYFNNLELPSHPTIYDYLILSLRDTDVIASFNWDPFLVQAYLRVRKITDLLPTLLFLHGTVALSRCPKDLIVDLSGNRCEKCGKMLEPIKLLYPVSKKDYTNDVYINEQWSTLNEYMKDANGLTIFGYGAPKTDVEAINLLKSGWGNPDQRIFEEVEIINIEDEELLIKKWSDFIHSSHYSIHADYYESSIAKFPRRVNECHFQTGNLNIWLNNHRVEPGLRFNQLEKEFRRIIKFETN